MSATIKATQEMEASTRIYLQDPTISLTMARCPAFGNEDICIIINGDKAEKAAMALAGVFHGTVERQFTPGFRSIPGRTCYVLTAPVP